MNPRTLNFFPPSFIVIEHLYIFPLSGSRISPQSTGRILGEIPDDSKTNEAPVFEITRAPHAAGIRIIRIGVDQPLDLSVELAVFFPDIYKRIYFPCEIVHRLPTPNRSEGIRALRAATLTVRQDGDRKEGYCDEK
jgi:hypothetical protein